VKNVISPKAMAPQVFARPVQQRTPSRSPPADHRVNIGPLRSRNGIWSCTGSWSSGHVPSAGLKAL